MEIVKEKTGIKFKKDQLKNFAVITAPGKYELECSSNVTDRNLYTDAEGRSRYITGFKAIPIDKLAQLKAAFEGKEEVDIEDLNGITLTGASWINPGREDVELAVKGEKVTVVIGEVEDREKNVVLRVTNMQVKKAASVKKLDIDKFFAPETEEVTSNEESKTLVHN
jgi:hypothetical protein